MADLKISQLAVATTPSGGELLPIVQSGTTKQVTLSNLLGLTPSSGNLGLGVTPSAWASAFKALETSAGFLAAISTNELDIGQNHFYSSSLGNWAYKNSAGATQYRQTGSEHRWFTAPSGTAGNAISFTQAMTLDASGHLLVGATSNPGTLNKSVVVDSGAGQFAGVVMQNDATGRAFNNGGTLHMSNTNMVIANYANGNISVFSNNNLRVVVKAEGQLRFVPLAAAPTTNVENGDVYYDSTTNKLRVRAAGAWVDLH